MKLRNSALALAALLVVSLGSGPLVAADQTKSPPPLTLKTVPLQANVPTPRPKADTSLFLDRVTAYIGANAVITPRVTFSGGPAGDRRWAVPSCHFEVAFPSLPTQTYDKPCNAPFSIDVPDDRHYDSTGVSARVLASADLNMSLWYTANVSFRSGPTLLEINHGSGQLPANLAPVAGITAAENVIVTLYKIFPDGSHRTPLPNRSVVVTVTGGQPTAVPKSDAQGDIAFQVLHASSVTPSLHVLFQGDVAYASSHASATLTSGGPPPHGHVH